MKQTEMGYSDWALSLAVNIASVFAAVLFLTLFHKNPFVVCLYTGCLGLFCYGVWRSFQGMKLTREKLYRNDDHGGTSL